MALGAFSFVAAPSFSDSPSLFDSSLEDLLNITVTAQKREERLQSIAVSVTALSSAELAEYNIRDITEISHYVPGLMVGQTGYDARPAMRGSRTQQVESNDQSISIYQDGITRPRHVHAMMPYLDLERVEVMRGPQGTLFGRNSFGGTINTVTKQPQLDETFVQLKSSAGNYHAFDASGIINIPIHEQLALRVSHLSRRHASYVENTFNPEAGLKDQNTHLTRFQLLYNTDNETLILRHENWQEDSNGNGIFGYKISGVPFNSDTGLTDSNAPLTPRIGRDDSCGSPCGRYGAGLNRSGAMPLNEAANVVSSPYRISSDYQPTQIINDTQSSVFYTRALSHADLTINAASMRLEDLRLEDADFSPYSSTVEGYSLNSKTDTIEAHLTSNTSERFEWITGIYFLSEKLDYAFLWQDLIDLENNRPAEGAIPKNEWASWMSQLDYQTYSRAIYGQLRINLGDNINLVTGLRHTKDIRQWQLFGQNPNNLSVIDFSEATVPLTEKRFHQNTAKIGAEYQLDEHKLLYVSFTSGYLAGNFYRGTDSYDHQKVVAAELGSKNQFFDNHLRLNISIYRNHFSDLLATDFEDIGGTTVGAVKNAGDIRATGAELELDWELNTSVQLGLRGHYSNARYNQFITANPFESGGTTINGVDNLFHLDGKQVALNPDFTLTGIASYTLPEQQLGQGKLNVTAHLNDGFRTSDEVFSFGNQPSYSQFDAVFSWHFPGDRSQATIFARNITNEAILLRSSRYGGNVAAQEYGAPRVIGISFKTQF